MADIMGAQSTQIDEFNLQKLITNDAGERVNPRIGIIAKSGSGKSYIIRSIMYYLWKSNIPCGLVIAPSD